MARGEPPRSGPPLPAPYRSPWTALAEALPAVAADLRLSLQRLWRRNCEGELPRPALWPQQLAPLFWPLLLSAALLLAGLGIRLLHSLAPSTPAPATPAAAANDGTASDPRSAPWPAPWPASGQPGSAPPPAARPSIPGSLAAPSGSAGTGAQAGAAVGPGRERSATGSAEANPEAAGSGGGVATTSEATPQLRLDPLLELISQGEEAGLLLLARPDPATSRLSLTLSETAAALPQAALLEQAQRWQKRAREAGYERLELRDPQGRLRGRGALVGSGMILLAPVPGS